MANPFVHVELWSEDVDKAKAFYTGLFDWKLEDVPMAGPGGGGMTYTVICPGEGTGGGMMKNPVPGSPPHWMPYVVVDDLSASTSKAKSLGATVAVEPTEIPNVGWYSLITDPSGATLGLFQDANH